MQEQPQQFKPSAVTVNCLMPTALSAGIFAGHRRGGATKKGGQIGSIRKTVSVPAVMSAGTVLV